MLHLIDIKLRDKLIFYESNCSDMNTIESPIELIQKFQTNETHKQFINRSRCEIQNILDGKDSRLLVIVGPCSIHDISGALEFAARLKQLQETCSTSLFFVMRTYFEKARTSYGWKGLLYDPYLNGSNQISHGLHIVREFLVKLAEMKVPAACEFLDPSLHAYIGDLISWSCIGARTTASQVHRQLASGLAMPVGFKNTPEGNIETAIHGILSSSKPHTFLTLNQEGKIAVQKTRGNTHSHLILRGGEDGPNYHPEAISRALEMLKNMQLPERLIVDCSHDNSEKKYELQPAAFHSVLNQIIEGNHAIRGAMLESYLYAGNQPLRGDLQYGISITDSCLSWETTEDLLQNAHDHLCKENHQEAIASLKCASV